MQRKTYVRLSQAAGLLALAVFAAPVPADTIYQETDLVSDIPGVAPVTDPNLAKPWGIDRGDQTPFWISDSGTSKSTVYNGAGRIVPRVVNVPGDPTGIAFNGTSGFQLSNGSKALFLFAGEGGVVSGWNLAAASNAVVAKDQGIYRLELNSAVI